MRASRSCSISHRPRSDFYAGPIKLNPVNLASGIRASCILRLQLFSKDLEKSSICTVVQEPVERLHATWWITVATMRCRPWSRSLFHMRHQTSTLLTRAARRHLSKHSVGHKSISDILDLLPAVNDSEPLRIDATGHVRTVRNQRHMSFVELGDGSTSRSLQAILDPPQAEKYAYNIAQFRTVKRKRN